LFQLGGVLPVVLNTKQRGPLGFPLWGVSVSVFRCLVSRNCFFFLFFSGGGGVGENLFVLWEPPNLSWSFCLFLPLDEIPLFPSFFFFSGGF